MLVVEGLAQFWPITLGQSTYLSTFPKDHRVSLEQTILFMYIFIEEYVVLIDILLQQNHDSFPYASQIN